MLRICDTVAESDITHKCKKSKCIRLHITNLNNFLFFLIALPKKSYDKKHLRFQPYAHFTLVSRVYEIARLSEI